MAAQAEETQRFAFGADEKDNCQCPAIAAGFDSAEFSSIITRYDGIAKYQPANAGSPTIQGTLPEAQARHAWEEAVEELAKKYPESANSIRRRGDRVKQALGWTDENE